MKKRIASLFLAAIMLIQLATSVFPIHVHATGLYCEGCGEWKDDSVNWCSNCYLCEDCVDGWCPDCANCYLCGYELGLHCPECFESCVDPSYGNVPHCVSCMKCENWADLTDTSNGPLCEDCLEDFQENGANKMCANCGVNVIYNEDLDEKTEACADCGEHCVNCCEFVCDNCGTCADGAGIDFCEECGKCENCWEHCEVCEECFEENGECEEHGDHCAECCIREGWICDGCGRCTEALGLEFCEYCGLCEECCRENSKYYGVKECILDKETKPETLDPSKHDENHHILRYNSSSEECHDVWCIFPGCDYYLSDCTPHEFQWKTVKEPLLGVNGLKKGICVYCGHETEEVIPMIQPSVYSFIESPGDMEVLKEKSFVSGTVRIGVVGDPEGSTVYSRVAAIPVEEGEVLPETWAELRKNIYYYGCIKHDSSSDKTGVYKFMIGGTSNAALAYGGKYVDFTAQGKKLTWRLAVYDGRGDGTVNKVGYSDPFTIDWNAKHTKHTAVWVSG